MGACTAFIFAALIEFTVVNYLWRKYKMGFALAYMEGKKKSSDNANKTVAKVTVDTATPT